MRLILTTLGLTTLVAVTSACGSATFRPFVGAGDPAVPSPFPSPEEAVNTDISTRATRDLQIRQACRSGATTRGWIAVSYLQLGRDCPRDTEDGGYNGVLLARYDDRPIGSILVVCADQPIPRDWVRDGSDTEMVCEGARVDDGEPTTRTIRRVR